MAECNPSITLYLYSLPLKSLTFPFYYSVKINNGATFLSWSAVCSIFNNVTDLHDYPSSQQPCGQTARPYDMHQQRPSQDCHLAFQLLSYISGFTHFNIFILYRFVHFITHSSYFIQRDIWLFNHKKPVYVFLYQ